MKILVLSLTFLLAFPTIASAKSYYLILSKRGTGLERIEMDGLLECEQLGKQWGEVSSGHTYVCLESK